LIRTISELKSSGVNTKLAILDAGYYSDDNIQALYDSIIAFVTRIKENKVLYKDLIANHPEDLEKETNIVGYNVRFVYIKRVKCRIIKGNSAYACIGLDIERKNHETKKLFYIVTCEGMDPREVHRKRKRQGIFILISSKRLETTEILPIYYTRQLIEQIFDVGKNYANLIPLKIHKEETFRGHLLLTFIATMILNNMQLKLKDSLYDTVSLFMNLKNQKYLVYNDKIITNEPRKKINNCYKLFGFKYPGEIPLQPNRSPNVVRKKMQELQLRRKAWFI
jgi:transposase